MKDEKNTSPNAGGCPNETEAQEREHLRNVIGQIEQELGAFGERLDSRLSESREMVNLIQEQKRDMDHSDKAVMRQSVNVLSSINEQGMTHFNRLQRLVESPYFGRIDLASDGDDRDHPVYVGLHAFADPETGEQLVHDWRAPVSSMFYDFELGPAHYVAPEGRLDHEITRKRQYQIEQRELRFMLDTSLSIQDEILREELSRSSDDAMKNIVATIQREQNAIIRNDTSHALIIQGAAGSGKTSIALHRIAYLLYRHRDEIHSNEILIVSPNNVFASYIAKVLPELGEEMIQETTMETIAGRILGASFKAQTFAEQVATLLGGKDKAYADRVRFKATPEFLDKLDGFIAHVRATNVEPRDVSVPPYTVDADWIGARFRKYASTPIRDQIKRVLDDLVEHMNITYQKKLAGRDRTRVKSEITSMVRHTTLAALYKAFYEWLGEPKMFKKARGGRYEYADVFPLIYLMRLVEPVTSMQRIKHVVIDEMQDYTPVQYRVVDALFHCKKTILGDHNQSVSPLSASAPEDIRDALRNAECMYMHKSYRSTIQITEVAQTIQRNPDLHPIERHGNTPELAPCPDDTSHERAVRDAIDAFHASDHNTLGIICKTDEQAAALHKSIADTGAQLLDTRSTTFTGGVMIATAYLAKGLEFDRVVVPFADKDTYAQTIDKHMLYVACTRAMHELTIICEGEPTALLDEAVQRDHLRVRDVSPS